MQKVQGVCSFGDPLAQCVSPCLQYLHLLVPRRALSEEAISRGSTARAAINKRAVSYILTGSDGTVEAVGLSSSTPVVSGGAVAAERCLSICEGELCPLLLIQAQIDSHLFEHPPSLTFNR